MQTIWPGKKYCSFLSSQRILYRYFKLRVLTKKYRSNLTFAADNLLMENKLKLLVLSIVDEP